MKALAEVRGTQRVTDPEAEGKYQSLAKYTRDLTELGPQRQARPGDRPRRGDPPRHAGALAPHQEQPGADRRSGRRQDRHRRGDRAAHRGRRRPRVAEGQEDSGARPGRAHRRDQVPRRVRGSPQGGAQGDRGGRRRRHPVHRRAAHAGRRGGRRGGGRRRQHAQAGAGARRSALHRRHHARRVPEVHREGQGARAALPAGLRRRAVARGHGGDPPRSQGALRGPPRHPDPRRGAGRRGAPVAPLHPGAAAPRQGDRSRRRGGQPAQDADRLAPRPHRSDRAAADVAGHRGAGARQGEGRGVGQAAGARSPPRSPSCASAPTR